MPTVDKNLRGVDHGRVKAKKPADDNHRPFRGLGDIVEAAGLRLHPEPEVEIVQEAPPVVSETENEELLFSRAMDGVRHVDWRPAPAATPAPTPPPARDPELEERRLMEAAVEGDPALTLEDHPEYIEGWIGLGGRRYLPKLRNGLYSIQGQIDLHGLSREEARSAVEAFICRMSRDRSCCIKVIHGRGINSPNDRAVLKESLHQWLSSRRMSRHVVAYASAPFSDGGVGAIYVLLRRSL